MVWPNLTPMERAVCPREGSRLRISLQIPVPLHFLSLGLHSSPTSTPGDQGYLTIVPSVISFLLPSSPSQPFQISLGNTHGGSGLVGGVQGTVNSGMWELPVMCHCCNYGPKWLFC